jgi:hypothetical protein
MENEDPEHRPEGEEHPEHHPEGEERQEEEGEGGRKDVEMYNEHWQRDDRAEWTVELGQAHAAFEVGRAW